MTSADLQWAYKAVVQFARTSAPALRQSSTTRSSSSAVLMARSHPQLMLSHSSTRSLLLATRSCGVVGIELGGEWQPLQTQSLLGSCLKKTQLRRLMKYFQQRRLCTIHTTCLQHLRREPLLIHTNQLVGWRLNASASSVYAHTLKELQGLRVREAATLTPGNCVVATQYCEWDSWREVLCEPGWQFYSMNDDSVLDGIIQGNVQPHAIEPKLVQEIHA